MLQKNILISTLLLFSSLVFSQSKKYEAEFIDTPIDVVIKYLEVNHGLLFSYKNNDLLNKYITENIAENNLELFLNKIFNPNGFDVEIIEENYVILKKEINLIEKNEAAYFNICGKVIDRTENVHLIWANIYLQSDTVGTVTDTDGTFDLMIPFKKKDTVIISYIGYQTQKIPLSYFVNNGCPDIFMEYGGPGPSVSITVTEYLTDGIELTANGDANILNPNNIGALPGQVEPDIFSTINFLPGISSSTGEHSKFNVRGGASDQNLVMWEGIPIYQPAHYFGMISAFNPYIIDEIKVYRGGFGAEYGGRISGIVDMSSKKPFSNKPNFGAGFNFLNGYAYGKTNFLKNKGYLIFSARHSINDIWRSPTFNNITRKNQQSNIFENIDIYDLPPHISISDQINFFDTQLKGSIQATEKDELSIAYFFSNNKFNDLIRDDKIMNTKTDDLKLKNSGASFSWKHNWTDNFSTKASVVTAQYDLQYNLFVDHTIGNKRDYGLEKQNNVRERQIKLFNEYITENNHILSVGFQNLDFNLDLLIERDDDKNVRLEEKEEFNSDINVFHAGIKTDPYRNFGIDAGIRWNHYSINNNNYFEPRIRFWANLLNNLTVNAHVGKYNQFISQLVELRGNQEGIEMPIWVMTGERGKDEPVVLTGTQYQVGAIYRKDNWLIDIQLYTKEIKGISSLSYGFDTDPRQELGDAEAKGIDILLKKRWRNYRSWLSYSLSKTIYKFKNPEFVDNEFAAPFDQRHSLNWIHLYHYKRFEFSLGMEFTSGNPYSVMQDFRVEKDNMQRDVYVYEYDELYNQNLTFQHRIDLSVRYKFEPLKNGKSKGILGFSIFNVFDNRNDYARDYFVRDLPNMQEEIQFVDKAHLGFTPNMVFRLEW